MKTFFIFFRDQYDFGKNKKNARSKPPFFKEHQFLESLLGSLTLNIRHCVQPCFNLGQILNQAKVAGPQKACHAESRCNFFIFVSKIKCSVKKKMDQDSIYGFLSKHENFAAHFNPFHGTQFGKPCYRFRTLGRKVKI